MATDYTIEYTAERILPVGMRGDVYETMGVKVYECSCVVKNDKGAEIDARFSLAYTQEEADTDPVTMALATPGARLAAYRNKLAKARLAEMLASKGMGGAVETHPAIGSSLAVSKADLEPKAVEPV